MLARLIFDGIIHQNVFRSKVVKATPVISLRAPVNDLCLNFLGYLCFLEVIRNELITRFRVHPIHAISRIRPTAIPRVNM